MAIEKEKFIMAKRLSTVLTGDVATNVQRKDLDVFDLYSLKAGGRVLMHTGVRTSPPSAAPDGGRGLARDADGNVVVGYQSVVVQGKIKDKSDGAVFTSDGEKPVIRRGRAQVSLTLAA
jgi:hypothetical protein